MTKHRQFTRLSSESESSLSQTSAIPLQAIAPPDPATINVNTSFDSQPILPNVPFIPVSPLRRGSIPGLDLDEEWPLTEIPQELRGSEEYTSTSANNTEANSMRTDWKRELFLLLEDPSSSRPAFFVNVFVSFSIILSAVLTTVETIPTFRSTSSSVWFNFETTIVVIFTIEYVLRLFAHSDSFKQLWRFAKTPLAIIDFIAVVPYYIELAFHHDTTYDFRFTILRLFRLLRVFKAFKYTSTIIMTIEVMIVAVKRSIDALGALFFFMVTSVVLFSTLLYFAERGTWDQDTQKFVDSKGNPSSFDSIPSAFWFVMVTITTTGYGDMVPTTFVGKLIAFPAMMCGILLIALPSIIVGRNFTLVWEAMRQYRRLNSTREHISNDGTNGDEGPDFRISLESTHSYAPQTSRGYSSTNDLSASQDALLEQIFKLTKISQQNQDTLEKILRTLEQNDIKLCDTPDKITTPEKSATTIDEIMTPEKSDTSEVS